MRDVVVAGVRDVVVAGVHFDCLRVRLPMEVWGSKGREGGV